MNRTLFLTVAELILMVGVTAVAQENKNGSSVTLFEPPVRLKVNGEFIDTGSAWGHSSPCIADVDNDGLDDLMT